MRTSRTTIFSSKMGRRTNSSVESRKRSAKPKRRFAMRSPNFEHGNVMKTTHPSNSDTELHNLFVDQLRDILWAEKQLVKALPKMANEADPEVRPLRS